MVYPGGKSFSGAPQKIINQMPSHSIYVEAFLGGGAILRTKKPAPAGNIGIDSDAVVIESFGQPVEPLTLLCDDAVTYLARTEFPDDALIYCDPPYLLETRSCKRAIYKHEMLYPEEHMRLLSVLLAHNCRVMISGYWSQLYENMLTGWRAIQWQANTRKGPRTEWLWMNYPEPVELHDYRFLGENFRQRERIKRKQNRWRTRLEKMDSQERYALLSVLEELRCSTTETGDTTR